MTQTTPSIGLDLSDQELWYILRQFPGQAIPGAKRPDMKEEELLVHLEAGANSLQARGLMAVNIDNTGQTQVSFDRVIGGLVGAGVLAEHVLLLSYEPDAVSGEVTWVYFAPDIVVAHNRATAGVQRFFVVNTGDLFISTLILALHLDLTYTEVAAYEELRIPSTLLNDMRQTPEAAYDRLSTAVQADKATLLAFAKAVLNPKAYCQVVMVHRDTQPTNQFRLLLSDDSYWALEEEGTELICQPVVPLQITGLINDWVSRMKR